MTAAIIGWIESFRARNKMALNAQYILSINAVALVLIFVAMIIKNKIVNSPSDKTGERKVGNCIMVIIN